MKHIIKSELLCDNNLLKILKSIRDITIIEYDATKTDGSFAILDLIDSFDNTEEYNVTIILCGYNHSEISKNETLLKHKNHHLNIISTGLDWEKQNFNDLDINGVLIFHMLTNVDGVNKSSDIFNINNKRRKLNHIVESTRKAYYAVIFKDEQSNLFSNVIKMDYNLSIGDIRFQKSTATPDTPSLFCSDRQEYMESSIQHLTPKDAFFICFDEMESGCTECNQCKNYNKMKQCPAGQRRVAEFYREGRFLPENSRIAHQWEMKAARQGYTPSILEVANDFIKGYGCDEDLIRGIKIYSRFAKYKEHEEITRTIIDIVESDDELPASIAIKYIAMKANDGDVSYIKRLIDAFENGRYGLPVDSEQQHYWEELLNPPESDKPFTENQISILTQNAESGDLKAQIRLCETYWYGKMAPRNYEKCAYWGEKAIEQGDKSVRFIVAYSCGKSGMKERAKEIYSELAEEGNIAALNNLACIETDSTKCAQMFKRAADAGDEVAQCNIGRYYKRGTGVEQSYSEAIRYFEMSAGNNYTGAMKELADLYRYGHGVEKDADKMVMWYEKAAKNGDAESLMDLAFVFRKGIVVETDKEKAYDYYRRAVQTAGENALSKDSIPVNAIYNLGEMTENGEGVLKNVDKAIFWYRKAALHEHELSIKALKRLKTNWMNKDGKAVYE